MRRPESIKDVHLTTSSDLIVFAPIRAGFVPALDAVTYRTRAERVLRTLHAGRSLGHEFDLARVLSDAVERVGRIHSVRIAVLEPQGQAPHLMLAVTFDGSWASYVRVIWQKVARLLDLLFCNTEDYVVGWTASFEDWDRWLRFRQAKSAFLYSTPGLSFDDVHYLRMGELLSRHRPGSGVEHSRLAVSRAETIAYSWFADATHPHQLGLGHPMNGMLDARPEVFRQGLRSLAGLYRLADWYLPGTPDGAILHAAARELLPDFLRMLPSGDDHFERACERARLRFADALAWIDDTSFSLPQRPASPPLPAEPECGDLAELQGGLLEPYKRGEHGLMLLLAFDSAAALAGFLQAARPTSAKDQAGLGDGAVTLNIALTLQGLRLAGLDDAEVDCLPAEFVQGMERRAGLLGDIRSNHPLRWSLPAANWSDGANAGNVPADAPVARVALGAVHVLLQARRISKPKDGDSPVGELQARQEILKAIAPYTGLQGVKPLSLQWMARVRDPGSGRPIEHFGYQDGIAEPTLRKDEAGRWFGNQVHAGELLIGAPNAAGPAPQPPADETRAAAWVRELLHRGSFLVVRKLRQDAARFHRMVDDAVTADATAAAQSGISGAAGIGRPELQAKLMGRYTDGRPLAQPLVGSRGPEDFVWSTDPQGQMCPFHAHIRRANPRPVVPPELESQLVPGARQPRLFRRGMPYGPAWKPADSSPTGAAADAERGLIFMAYNASIGEQFETIQAWLSGGNSSGGYSGQPDPIVGLPEPGLPRIYRFEHAGRNVHVRLDGSEELHGDPQPLVRLEWGGYFFTPTLPALQWLVDRAKTMPAGDGRRRLPWSADKGRESIQRLREIERREGHDAALQAWKVELEDTTAAVEVRTGDLWAAIREHHGGVLRTPYGVLVADPDMLTTQVLRNQSGALTSTAYLPRMRRSFGEIYLGMDPSAGPGGNRYAVESKDCNDAIMQRDFAATLAESEQVVADRIRDMVHLSRMHAQEDEHLRRAEGCPPIDRVEWELTLELRELIEHLLGHFCETWFGMREMPGQLVRAGQRWPWREGEPACYPGHFMAPSRYIFQAHPGPDVERIGASHGKAMLAAVQAMLDLHGKTIKAPIARAVLDSPPALQDPSLAARNLVGAMMGMVPTIDANLRRAMNLWLEDGTLWSLRAGSPSDRAIETAFVRAMLERAAPDTLWRTAVNAVVVGQGPHAVNVQPGELVVGGLVSATNRQAELDQLDVTAAFGGDRTGPNPPPHACPGYRPAMAMMLGFARALVRLPLGMRAGPSPLTIRFEGWDAYQPPPAPPNPAPSQDFGGTPFGSRQAHALWTAEHADAKPLWVFGDSWLDPQLEGFDELLSHLPAQGYAIAWDRSHHGRTLNAMVAHASTVAQRLAAAVRPPLALLIGGGGNDLVIDARNRPQGTVLFSLLDPNAGAPDQALKPGRLKWFVHETLESHYRQILDTIVPIAKELGVKLFIHGYDYPTPDGRAAIYSKLGIPIRLAGEWLKPVFESHGMNDLLFNRRVMRELIDSLNGMLAGLAGAAAYSGVVHHLKLNGVLPIDPVREDGHLVYWENEIHPSSAGYELLAKAIAQQLRDAGA